MDETLAKLEAWLSQKQPEVFASLRAGADDVAIAACELRIGRKLPPELAALHRWRDGQNEGAPELELDADEQVRWLSLEEIATAYEELSEYGAEGAERNSSFWAPGWIPFIDRVNGNYVCVDGDGAFGGEQGQVINYWHDTADRAIEAPSLRVWLDAVALNGIEERGLLDDTIKELARGYPRHIA